MKKLLIRIGATLLVLFAAFIVVVRIQSRKPAILAEKCRTLKLGDSDKMVLELLGDPISQRPWDYDQRKISTWVYPAAMAASTDPQIYIENGKVIWIICSEGYHLGRNPLKDTH